jgi:serine/threonine protein kinase/tetratricopeptide (TPR) repeat protein
VQIDDIFIEALEHNGRTRATFLADACAGDPELLERVTALLAAHAAAGDFLNLAESQSPTRSYPSLEEGPGTMIGRYKLLEQIGEGGFGVVFMAEQIEPVRRRVALKIIKLGMDTKQVVARFDAERQALAMMDHPNVAKVLDAGATETGRPYFVMELIKGVTITTYCDQHKLTTTDRLKLFAEVCAAVQHAHQKGVIHRDLKPTNVLVTLHDDKPVPKIIDFGIAKATQGRLTEQTLFTEFRQLIGTPTYMSPEQAQMSGLDVDTRSDIYSLGVLLYELLTGTTPFEAKQLLSVAHAEMQRMIREIEPPTPSTRLSTLSAEGQSECAADRGSDPKRLMQTLRGDLDWIVMRCLEKDRSRRYETVNGLAKDLARHLANQPVEARRPTLIYRLKKFARRNRWAVLVASTVLAAILGGMSLGAIGLLRARQEAVRSDQVAQFIRTTLAAAGPSVARGRDATLLREILETTAERVERELKDQPEVQGELYFTLGSTFEDIGDRPRAVTMLRRAVDSLQLGSGGETRQFARALGLLGKCQSFTGDVAAGRLNTELALNIARTCGDPETVIACLVDRARAFDFLGVSSPEGAPYMREAVELQRRYGKDPLALAHGLRRLSGCVDNAEAEKLLREAIAIDREHAKPDGAEIVDDEFALAQNLLSRRKFSEAEKQFRATFLGYRKLYDDNHPYQPIVLRLWAEAVFRQGKGDEAEEIVHSAVIRSPTNAGYWNVFGSVMAYRRNYSAATDHFSRALELEPENLEIVARLAVSLAKDKRPAEYQQLRHKYFSHIADAGFKESDLDTARAFLLSAVSPDDIALANRLAQIDSGSVEPPRNRSWVNVIKALHALQVGDFGKARGIATTIENDETDQWPPRRAEAYLIKATACAQLKDAAAARQALSSGSKLIEQADRDAKEDFLYSWLDWTIADVLAADARVAIGKN